MGNFVGIKKSVDQDVAFNTLLKTFVLNYAEEKCDKALFPFQQGVGLDKMMIAAKFGAGFFDGEMPAIKTILDAICCSAECSGTQEHWDPIYSGWQQEKAAHGTDLSEYPISGCQVKADIEDYCLPLGYEFM